MIWPFKKKEQPRRGPAVTAMADALRLEPSPEAVIDPLGICELTVPYRGQHLNASWYETPSGWVPRHIALNRDRFFAASDDARYLIGVARSRAHSLLAERVRALDAEAAT